MYAKLPGLPFPQTICLASLYLLSNYKIKIRKIEPPLLYAQPSQGQPRTRQGCGEVGPGSFAYKELCLSFFEIKFNMRKIEKMIEKKSCFINGRKVLQQAQLNVRETARPPLSTNYLPCKFIPAIQLQDKDKKDRTTTPVCSTQPRTAKDKTRLWRSWAW